MEPRFKIPVMFCTKDEVGKCAPSVTWCFGRATSQKVCFNTCGIPWAEARAKVPA